MRTAGVGFLHEGTKDCIAALFLHRRASSAPGAAASNGQRNKNGTGASWRTGWPVGGLSADVRRDQFLRVAPEGSSSLAGGWSI